MLSLRNFYVYITTLWSSQGNLSSKKSKKTEEKGQVTKRVTLAEKRDMISQGRTHVFGNKENMSHSPKRDTICETLILFLVTQGKTCHDLLKTLHDLGEFLSLFKLKTIQKTRVTILES